MSNRKESFMKNMKVTLGFYVINIFLAFLSRSIFIKVLGADISGLNSLFINLIGFLNIAELGVGAAIGYSLYKPLSEKNYNKINEIMILFKYYYRNIAKIIFLLGIIVSLFLPLFIKDQVSIYISYLYYYLYLINCIATYFFTYKQTLIISDQKQYKITYILNIFKIFKILIQCIQLLVIPSFIIWLIIEIIFNLGGMFLANKKIDCIYYKYINYKSKYSFNEIKSNNLEIGKNIKNIFFHKIAGFIVFQTDTILISLFITLKDTAIYANYMMVINNISGLINNAIGCIMPTIGNVIAEESKEKCYDIFKQLYILDHFMAIIISYVSYIIINKFITFWVGNEYLFNKGIVLVLMLNLYIQISRGSVERFKDGFGIYWDIKAPIIESIINLIFSVILCEYIGVIGIFLGTLISNIIIVKIWKPFILFKEGFQKESILYFKDTIRIYIKNILIIISSNFLYGRLCFNINNNFINLLVNFILVLLICIIISLFIYIINKDFRKLLRNFLGKYIKVRK